MIDQTKKKNPVRKTLFLDRCLYDPSLDVLHILRRLSCVPIFLSPLRDEAMRIETPLAYFHIIFNTIEVKTYRPELMPLITFKILSYGTRMIVLVMMSNYLFG